MPKFEILRIELSNTEWEMLMTALDEYSLKVNDYDRQFVVDLYKKLAVDNFFNGIVTLEGLN